MNGDDFVAALLIEVPRVQSVMRERLEDNDGLPHIS